MLPIYSGGHTAYQDTFVSDFLKFFPEPLVLTKATWDVIVDFWYLDLLQTDSLLQHTYSKFGPRPRLPSSMLRSYLLSIKLKVSSSIKWVQSLKENPLYAIVSGFSVGDVPGIGTFYDFFSRMWGSDSNNLLPKERYKNKKVKKDKNMVINTNSSCSKLIPFFERNMVKKIILFY